MSKILRKSRIFLSLFLLIAFAIVVKIYAATITLDYLSERTYVKSEHENGLDFSYRGLLSICGADRSTDGVGFTYPYSVSITYRYNGKDTRYTLDSLGEFDYKVRKATYKYYDSLNPFAPKTEVFGKIYYDKSKSMTPYRLNNSGR